MSQAGLHDVPKGTEVTSGWLPHTKAVEEGVTAPKEGTRDSTYIGLTVAGANCW